MFNYRMAIFNDKYKEVFWGSAPSPPPYSSRIETSFAKYARGFTRVGTALYYDKHKFKFFFRFTSVPIFIK